MKKIACVGHHCTGAGVIDDLFRECDNVAQGEYEVEFRLLQDADGISDLEYNLVDNPHRLYSGYALRRYLNYIKNVKRGYKSLFGPYFYKMAEDYVNSLAKFRFRGIGFLDFTLEPWYGKLFYWTRRATNKLCRRMGWKRNMNYLPWVYSYHVLCSEEEFLEATRRYIDQLCEAMNPQKKEYVVLDQCLSPLNPLRYMRYVNDLKVIIVDRDPRDIYIHQKGLKEYVLPIGDIHQYCQAFRDNRYIKGGKPNNILYIQFEDMIFHYDEMVQKVFDFVGIDKRHHINPKKYFNPGVSVRGIGTWRKHPEYAEDIKVIEEELPDFLYNLNDYGVIKEIIDADTSCTSAKDFKKFS